MKRDVINRVLQTAADFFVLKNQIYSWFVEIIFKTLARPNLFVFHTNFVFVWVKTWLEKLKCRCQSYWQDVPTNRLMQEMRNSINGREQCLDVAARDAGLLHGFLFYPVNIFWNPPPLFFVHCRYMFWRIYLIIIPGRDEIF